MESEQYMKQNKFTLNEEEKINIFENEKLPTVNCVELKAGSLKPTDYFR